MKTSYKIVSLLILLTFVFSLTTVAFAAKDKRIHGMTLIFASKQRYGTGIDKKFADKEFLEQFFGITIEHIKGNQFKVNTLYYPYTNKIKKYKNKYYFDIETFCKFFLIKYKPVSPGCYRLLDSTIPMFNKWEIKGPEEVMFKVGRGKSTLKTCNVKGKTFISLESLQEAASSVKVDESNKDGMGKIKVNGKSIYRWLIKDDVAYAYLSDINNAMPKQMKLKPMKSKK